MEGVSLVSDIVEVCVVGYLIGEIIIYLIVILLDFFVIFESIGIVFILFGWEFDCEIVDWYEIVV